MPGASSCGRSPNSWPRRWLDSRQAGWKHSQYRRVYGFVYELRHGRSSVTATAEPSHVAVGGSRVELAVRGGTVVPESGRAEGDVLVRDGRIVAVVTPGTDVSADEVVDASGMLVLPGLVDAHCHFNHSSHPRPHSRG